MPKNKTIFIGADHRGFRLKENLIQHMKDLDLDYKDLGTASEDSVDYPDVAHRLCLHMKENSESYGILICDTGIGMSIAANRHRHIRAALCFNEDMAALARKHNNANILVLGAAIIPYNKAKALVDIFLATAFEGGRHESRINKLNEER